MKSAFLSLSAGAAMGGSEVLIVQTVYSFDSLASNSMKSKIPHSGCRCVEVAKTLDCFDQNPAKNQGGGNFNDLSDSGRDAEPRSASGWL